MKRTVYLLLLVFILQIGMIPAAATGADIEDITGIQQGAGIDGTDGTTQDMTVPASVYMKTHAAMLAGTGTPTLTTLYSESFSGDASTVQNSIRGSQNGWSSEGTNYQIDVGDFGSDTGNSVRMASNDWYKNNSLLLNFQSAGVANESSKLHLSFKFKFDTGTGANYDLDSKSYVYITDTDGKPFASIVLNGLDMYLIALDSTGAVNGKYLLKKETSTVAGVRNDVLGIWYDVDMYVDTDNDTYTLKLDDNQIQTGNDMWIPASSDSSDGTNAASQKNLSGIGGIKIGNTWSSWWGYVCLDEIELDNYSDQPDTTATPTPTVAPTPTATPTATPASTAEPTTTPAPLYAESFTGDINTIQDFIKNKQGGWDYGGTNYQIDVGDFGSNTGNALRFSANDWYKNNWLSLNFQNAGVVNESNKLCLSFKFKFDTGTGENYDLNNKAYVYINDTGGKPFAAFVLNGLDMYLVALDYTGQANKQYLIKKETSTVAGVRNDVLGHWFDVRMYLDTDHSAYAFKINGVNYEGSDYGLWIPASSDASDQSVSVQVNPLTGIGGITLGNAYSSWWGSVNIDEISLSNYTTLPSDIPALETIPTPLPTPTPEPTPPPAAGSIVKENLYTNNFSRSATVEQTIITNEADGWKKGGDTYAINVGNYGSGDNNSLQLISTDWYKDNWLSLNFKKAGVVNESKKQHLSFKFKFDTQTGDNYDLASRSHIYIEDTDGVPFAAIQLNGINMYLTALNDGMTSNKFYLIQKESSASLGTWNDVLTKWYTADMYVDVDGSSYSLSISNGTETKWIEADNGVRWIPASSNANEDIYTAHHKRLNGVGGIEIGNTYSSWNGSVCLDNISLDNYYAVDDSKFVIHSLQIKNKVIDGAPIANGSQVVAEPEYTADSYDAAKITTQWNVSYDGGVSWEPMETDIVPDGAKKIKANVTAVSVYGQTATFTWEADVASAEKPSVTDVTISGAPQQDAVLTANYSYHSMVQGDQDHSTYQWYKTADIRAPFVKIDNAANKTYTLQEDDLNNFIKLEVTPCNMYGVFGEAKSYIMAPDDQAGVDAAAYFLSIDTNPSGDFISLPANYGSSDISFNAVITWKSDRTDIIENDGTIHRPEYGTTYVNLTATIAKSDALNVYSQVVFKVAITGSKGDTAPVKNPSKNHSGGGGGGGSAGSIAMPVIVSTSPESAQTPGSNTVSGIFEDVPDQFWASDYIKKLTAKEIISSKSSNFRPNDAITRAEFTKMIVEAFGLSDTGAMVNYTDVSSDDWAYVYVASASSKGIVNGFDGSFGKDNNITRQDLAVIIYRAAQVCNVELKSGTVAFSDNDSISDYALTSVGSLQSQGILSGSNGAFNPKGEATRAEAAKIISMMLDLIKK